MNNVRHDDHYDAARTETLDEESSSSLASVDIGSFDVANTGLELKRVYAVTTQNNDLGESEAKRAEGWVDQASDLLERQWPRGASSSSSSPSSPGESYRQKLIHSYHGCVEFYGLPCSYLLLKDNVCVGHGRLTECFESAGGNAAAATFIVIDSNHRGQGLGSHLMKGLEQEAKRLRYHYVYLWTKTAIPFYQKIGYHECQRVSLKRACLKALDTNQVETLEALLFRKMRRQGRQQQQQQHQDDDEQEQSSTRTSSANATITSIQQTKVSNKKAETILLPPSNDDEDESAPDVWLRKRLVEHVGSIHVSSSERRDELTDFIVLEEQDLLAASHPGDATPLQWRYTLLSLPWQAQIGPSCGLAALRMIREYFLLRQHRHRKLSRKAAADGTNGSGDDANGTFEESSAQLPSLLVEAQERGYTQDGEVFNANHLMDIAETVCGIQCEMWSTQNLQPQQLWKILREGKILLLPYDSNARTRQPALLGGMGAHYGIVVGLLVGTAAVHSGDCGMQSIPKDGLSPRLGEQTVGDGAGGVLENLDHDNGYYYLLVQHSLSSRLSVAPWSKFLQSNQQLDGVDQEKFSVVHSSQHEGLDLKNRIIYCRGMLPPDPF